MLRSLAVVLAVALLAALPNKPPGGGHGGRVHDLVGTWTCRNPAGVLSTVVFREENGDIVAEENTPGATATVRDRFRKDPSGWLVERDAGITHFSGYAPAWTTNPWVITDSQKHGTEIRYERAGDGTLWRTFSISGRPPYAGDVCAKGDVQPDPALCAVADIPPAVVRAMEPDTPVAAMQAHITGRVDVLVSLDAAGHVAGASIATSASPLLNDASLTAARNSTYRAALHDCKPVPGQYTFTVEYSGG